MASLPASPIDIATFERPPVVEVVAAVRTSPMRPETFFSLGAFWSQELRPSFPRFELAAPYRVVENSDPGAFGSLQFELSPTPELPRILLHGEAGTAVMQLQTDWFAANWRRVKPEDEYARWDQRRADFADQWAAYSTWLKSQDEDLRILHCETTYVNHIHPLDGLWTSYGDAAAVFAGPLSTSTGLVVEQARWQATFHIDGPIAGRVTSSIQPARSLDGKEMLVFEITARTGVDERTPGIESIVSSLDAGRNAVVSTFVELVSAEAKEAWGMRQ